MSTINKKAVKDYALDFAKRNRPRFTRVGASFIERVDMRLRDYIRDEIHKHPTMGVTLK